MRIFQTTISLAICLMIGLGTAQAHGGEQNKPSNTSLVAESSNATAVPMVVSPVNQGMIFGSVTGKARTVASIFSVSLYAADGTRVLISSQPLAHDGQFTFQALPDGAYWLFVESMGPTAVEAVPSAIRISLVDGQPFQQDVELR